MFTHVVLELKRNNVVLKLGFVSIEAILEGLFVETEFGLNNLHQRFVWFRLKRVSSKRF